LSPGVASPPFCTEFPTERLAHTTPGVKIKVQRARHGLQRWSKAYRDTQDQPGIHRIKRSPSEPPRGSERKPILNILNILIILLPSQSQNTAGAEGPRRVLRSSRQKNRIGRIYRIHRIKRSFL
jgi:hypothetical protein